MYGGAPAVLLGLWLGASRWARALFSPLAEALYAIPKIAILPLVLFIYGTGEEAMVRMVALSVFFLMLLSVYKGVLQIDPWHYEVARAFGAGRWQAFWSVTLPASMPAIVTSLQLGMGFALVVIVGSEFLAGGSGVGSFIWEARQGFRVVEMFAGLVVVGVMGYALALILARAGTLLLPWQPVKAPPPATQLQAAAGKYWRALRPWSFAATYVPVLVGSAVAAHQVERFDFVHFLLALMGALTFHAGTNLTNDYYDYIKGTDQVQKMGIGGSIQRGDFTPRFVLGYGLACFALGALIGLYFVSQAGPFILVLGVASLLAGFLYTA
ncbi:MAG: ABC transporter permease subunit, partial [Anaerolineae bacterium]|nr:ABC transporter permease subunit [Anaerolineae bacterium]